MQRIIQYIAKLRGFLFSINSISGLNLHINIYKPLRITSKQIRFGKDVTILNNSRIEAFTMYEGVKYYPIIELGNNVIIQQNVHLTCAQNIIIGDNTAIASNVTITDINHPYSDINTPIEKQKLEVNPVKIGNDCKIYNNAVILPGITIGKHVTIGANSVVNKDIPSFCVAVGNPIRIIKRYDFITQTWRKTNHIGEFID